MYGELVEGPSYETLIALGYLVRGRYFEPHSKDIADGLRRMGVASTGDFVNEQLSSLMRNRTIIGDVVQTWRDRAEGQSTICFGVDIAHSKELCDAFLQANVTAEHIDERTKEEDRLAMFERFRNGQTTVLCSVIILGVGFDEPIASCAILARPTLSLSRHIQQVGRVLRPFPGKERALVLDHSGNALRHGRVEDFSPPELSDLDKHSDRKTRATLTEMYPCQECRALMNPGQRVCEECGHEIVRHNTVDHIDGELVEGDAPHVGMDDEKARRLYRELRGYAEMQGYKVGWAYMQLLNRYDFQAPYDWKRLPTVTPSLSTLNLVKSWNIAYWKAKKKAEQRV
jgi:superfamily II DNA or RNA helicase